MKKSRYTEEQIIGILNQHEAGEIKGHDTYYPSVVTLNPRLASPGSLFLTSSSS